MTKNKYFTPKEDLKEAVWKVDFQTALKHNRG